MFLVPVVAALAIASSPAPEHRKQPDPRVTVKEARGALRYNARVLLLSFTESPPEIRISGCHRYARNDIRCTVEFKGDRLHARMRGKVAERHGDFWTWTSRLEVLG